MKTILFALCAGLMVQTTLPTVPQVNPTGLLGVNGTEHTGGAMAVSGTASGAVTDSGSGTEPADPVMDSETVPTEAAAGPEIAAPSALLMEASTGQVIYEKNADEKRSPASITTVSYTHLDVYKRQEYDRVIAEVCGLMRDFHENILMTARDYACLLYTSGSHGVRNRSLA